MTDFDDSVRRAAERFYADLIGRPGRRRAPRAPSFDPRRVEQPVAAPGISPGRIFDSLVYRRMTPESLLGGEVDGESWEVVALPHAGPPLDSFSRGDLVVERAMGEGALGSLHLVGKDIEAHELFGEDGLIRPNFAVLRPRTTRREPARPQEDARAAQNDQLDDEAGEEDEAEWSFGSLLRAAPRLASFPARPPGASGGRAFMEKIKGEGPPTDWVKRETAIVNELVSGNMPDSLLTWIRIDLAYKDSTRSLTGSIEVLADYLAVGSDDDFVHVPLDPVSAQLVADTFGAILPTARICHAIYRHAPETNRLTAIERDYWQKDSLRKSAKPGRAQTSTAAYLEHSEAIQARMKDAGLKLGALVAGHKKDVVISRRLLTDVNKIAFHGFYDSKGYPHEPCYENPEHAPKPTCDKDTATLAHSRRFSDYSQGVRLVNSWMIVNGEKKRVADVLADKNLSLLISNEGPIAPPRIPDTSRPSAAAPEAVMNGSAEVDAPATSAVTIEAAPGLGTSKTTAPIADVSPQRQMNEILDREMILFARARILADWIDRKFSSTIDQAVADTSLMARLDVSKDKKLRERLRPFPGGKLPTKRGQLFTTDAALATLLKTPNDAGGLLPVFELLRDFGVVLLPPNGPPGSRTVIASVTRVEARLERARFDAESYAIERRAVQFKRDVANPGTIHHAVESEAIPKDIWVDKNTPLEVARPVVALLRRLRDRNKAWRAGTYSGHWWNDFSIDAFIIANINKDDGFWARDAMREFFKALNAACEDTATPGPFAWKAIYNDKPLAQEIDRLYGTGRVLQADGHGPGPKMHVHLDVRPLTVPFDATTGFQIRDGRVVLRTPASAAP
jgi:hypothetical protein